MSTTVRTINRRLDFSGTNFLFSLRGSTGTFIDNVAVTDDGGGGGCTVWFKKNLYYSIIFWNQK